ncbi:MAG TPA: hypothetical protein VKX25_03315 [Bryobacteraceae bacterium]|jgi:hypothetical protein|nr:hypothetical protein [Bryobacteraceae bacterium]
MYAITKGGRKGQAEIALHVKLRDAITQQTIFEQDAHASLRNNPLNLKMQTAMTGGDASQTANGIAKAIAKMVRDHFAR